MRGPTQDARLEAIAGKPVVDVDQPTAVSKWPASGLVLFVGRFEPNLSSIQRMIMGSDAGTTFSGILNNNSSGSVSTQGAGVQVSVQGDFRVAWRALTPTVETLFIGASNTSLSQPYRGPMRALVYNHALTDYQIQRVITFLMRELKQE